MPKETLYQKRLRGLMLSGAPLPKLFPKSKTRWVCQCGWSGSGPHEHTTKGGKQ